MADYYQLLKRAVDSLPRSTPHAREEIYHRARMSLVSQLRDSRMAVPEAAIASEQYALNEAIHRLETQIKKEMQELSEGAAIDRHEAPIEPETQEASAPPAALRPAKPEPSRQNSTKPSGWLSDLLARASRIDEMRPLTVSEETPSASGTKASAAPQPRPPAAPQPRPPAAPQLRPPAVPETRVLAAPQPRVPAAPETRLPAAPEPKRFALYEAPPVRPLAPAPTVAMKDLDNVPPREVKQASEKSQTSTALPLNEKRSSIQRPGQSTFSSRTAQEKPMSRLDELNRVLRKLQSDSPGIEASALISEDGLMIASALPQGMEEARVAGMTATLLNLGSRGAVELNRGGVQEIIVRGERGYAVLISAGRGALLLALTNESSKLGLVFFDMREAIRAVQKVL
jgi:predicted regulator of Ras-like GTPase activity (Roadblock/LC7/MglB family)